MIVRTTVRIPAFFAYYFVWHYSQGLHDYLRVWGNFVWFVGRFFSFSALSRTLFSPWRRMDESYPKGFVPEKIFEVFVVNMLMRVTGAFVKILMMVVGLGVLTAVIAAGALGLIMWLVLPALIPTLAVWGLTYIVL